MPIDERQQLAGLRAGQNFQDVRFELPKGMEDALYNRFVEKTGIRDLNDFTSVYATIGTAQSTKCLGLFAKLGHVAGRKEYLPFLDICWRNIARTGMSQNWSWDESARAYLQLYQRLIRR